GQLQPLPRGCAVGCGVGVAAPVAPASGPCATEAGVGVGAGAAGVQATAAAIRNAAESRTAAERCALSDSATSQAKAARRAWPAATPPSPAGWSGSAAVGPGAGAPPPVGGPAAVGAAASAEVGERLGGLGSALGGRTRPRAEARRVGGGASPDRADRRGREGCARDAIGPCRLEQEFDVGAVTRDRTVRGL